MKILLTIAFFIWMFGVVCKSGVGPIPVEQPSSILTTYQSFLSYYSENIDLKSQFVAVDQLGKQITKDFFLKELTSGKFLPLSIKSMDNRPHYTLYLLPALCNPDIKSCLKGWAIDYYSRYSQIGKKFPAFNFVDIKGVHYTNALTKGKIIVLKGWNLTCPPCVREIPHLNSLVKRYKDRKDIIFLSVVPDSKYKVESFLLKRPFSYPVIPNEIYFEYILKLNIAPCHIIIDKKGYITTIVNTYEELNKALIIQSSI